MEGLDNLLSFSTLGFAVMLTIVTVIFRRAMEVTWPTLSTKTPTTVAERVWEGFVLPFTPAFLGAFLALVLRSYPLPVIATVSWSSRVVFGLVIGYFSAAIYSGIRFWVKKRWNVPLPDDSIPAPAMTSTTTTTVAVVQENIVTTPVLVPSLRPPPSDLSPLEKKIP